MSLTSGFNHVAFVTNDLDRLADFYKKIFDAEVVADMHARGIRHAMIKIGPSAVIHPFEMPDSDQTKPLGMFERGRLDHIALNAPTKEAFEEIRKRLVDAGASDGAITDFGSNESVFFRDPDGMEAEVCLWKDDATWADTIDPND